MPRASKVARVDAPLEAAAPAAAASEEAVFEEAVFKHKKPHAASLPSGPGGGSAGLTIAPARDEGDEAMDAPTPLGVSTTHMAHNIEAAMDGMKPSAAAAGEGVLKQLTYRLHDFALPGPLLWQWKEVIAQQFSMPAANITLFTTLGQPLHDETLVEDLVGAEVLLNVIAANGGLTPWVLALEGAPPAAKHHYAPHITGGSIAASVLTDGRGHGRGVLKSIHYRAELPGDVASAGQLRTHVGHRYSVPPACVSLLDLELKPLPDGAELAALYSGSAGGKLIARVAEAAEGGTTTTWVLQLSAHAMGRLQYRLAPGAATSAPTEAPSPHHQHHRHAAHGGSGSGAAHHHAAAAAAAPSFIEGDIILQSRGRGVLKRLTFSAPLAVKHAAGPVSALTLGALKKAVAASFSVPAESVGFVSTEMVPLAAELTLAEVPGATWIARIHEEPVAHVTGSGRLTTWVFSLSGDRLSTAPRGAAAAAAAADE